MKIVDYCGQIKLLLTSVPRDVELHRIEGRVVCGQTVMSAQVSNNFFDLGATVCCLYACPTRKFHKKYNSIIGTYKY